MTTIDHAAEARKLVADYCEIGEQSKKAGLTLSLEAIVTLTLSEAQVHAQLALVEQQRIANDHAELANRLAYLSIKRSVPSEHHDWIEEELGL